MSSLPRRDISHTKYIHPLKSKRHKLLENDPVRFRTFLAMLVLLIVTIVYYLLFSSYTRITAISINQTVHIPVNIVESVVDDYLAQNKLLLFNNNNYILFGSDTLKKILLDTFTLNEVTLQKKWPHTLTITIEEKLSFITLAYVDSDTWEMVYADGMHFKYIKPFAYSSDFPLVWMPSQSIFNDSERKFVLELSDIKQSYETLFRINYYTQKDSSTLVAHTDKNFTIHFNRLNNYEQQLNNLMVLVNQFKEKNILPSEYILLGFNEKIFYK